MEVAVIFDFCREFHVFAVLKEVFNVKRAFDSILAFQSNNSAEEKDHSFIEGESEIRPEIQPSIVLVTSRQLQTRTNTPNVQKGKRDAMAVAAPKAIFSEKKNSCTMVRWPPVQSHKGIRCIKGPTQVRANQ